MIGRETPKQSIFFFFDLKSLLYFPESAHAKMVSASNTPDGRGRIWFDNLNCNGYEANIFYCPREGNRAVGTHNCAHGEDVGVSCR